MLALLSPHAAIADTARGAPPEGRGARTAPAVQTSEDNVEETNRGPATDFVTAQNGAHALKRVLRRPKLARKESGSETRSTAPRRASAARAPPMADRSEPTSRTAHKQLKKAQDQKEALASLWLDSLMMPAQQLAQCLSVHARVPLPGERTAVRPVVRVQLRGSNAAPAEFTEILVAVMHLLVYDHSKYVQKVQTLLMTITSIKSTQTPCAALILPLLRTHEDFLRKVVSACYFWVGSNSQPLLALNILSSFAVPSTSADLPAARQTCALIRGWPKFSLLVQASLRLAQEPAAALVLGRFWDAVLGTPPQSEPDSAALADALSDLAKSSDLEASLDLLLLGLQTRAREASIISRYGGLAPLLRITSALLMADKLLAAIAERDALW